MTRYECIFTVAAFVICDIFLNLQSDIILTAPIPYNI